MKANLLILGALISGAILGAPAVKANSIVLQQNAYSFSDGGEFTAFASQNFLGGYVSSTILNGGFETFCVQQSVTFSPGSTYSFTLANMDSQGRVLTEGAAFLYYQFAKGSLSGYDYNNAANRQQNAGQLQAALWKLQGNQSGGSSFPNGGTGNPYYDLAVSTLGIGNITAANNGLYDVQVLQMWDPAGNTHQNQLVVGGRGVPDGGSSLAMLAAGLAGLCVVGLRTRPLQPALGRSR